MLVEPRQTLTHAATLAGQEGRPGPRRMALGGAGGVEGSGVARVTVGGGLRSYGTWRGRWDRRPPLPRQNPVRPRSPVTVLAGRVTPVSWCWVDPGNGAASPPVGGVCRSSSAMR